MEGGKESSLYDVWGGVLGTFEEGVVGGGGEGSGEGGEEGSVMWSFSMLSTSCSMTAVFDCMRSNEG